MFYLSSITHFLPAHHPRCNCLWMSSQLMARTMTNGEETTTALGLNNWEHPLAPSSAAVAVQTLSVQVALFPFLRLLLLLLIPHPLATSFGNFCSTRFASLLLLLLFLPPSSSECVYFEAHKTMREPVKCTTRGIKRTEAKVTEEEEEEQNQVQECSC